MVDVGLLLEVRIRGWARTGMVRMALCVTSDLEECRKTSHRCSQSHRTSGVDDSQAESHEAARQKVNGWAGLQRGVERCTSTDGLNGDGFGRLCGA